MANSLDAWPGETLTVVWEADVAASDQIFTKIRTVSDVLADGIVKQLDTTAIGSRLERAAFLRFSDHWMAR